MLHMVGYATLGGGKFYGKHKDGKVMTGNATSGGEITYGRVGYLERKTLLQVG